MTCNNFSIELATKKEINELLGLYTSVYGNDYPLELGTNKKVMLDALERPDRFLWLLARDKSKNVIAGSAIFEFDYIYKIGKINGVVVDKAYRKKGVASLLIKYGTEMSFDKKGEINSLYTTARTVSTASQRMFLANGFWPLGIFPNARKIKSYETLTLMGKFRSGVLEKQKEITKIPSSLSPILKTIGEITHRRYSDAKFVSVTSGDNQQNSDFNDHLEEEEFEFIYAPKFVERRFDQIFSQDRESLFYPFHKPNLLIACGNSDMEIYAGFNKKDHYCVLITSNKSILNLRKRFKKLIFAMKDLGIYYIETLVRIDKFDAINFLTINRFLPSAIYPAMREVNGEMFDYVLLTRTMVPLDFSEISIDDSFKPFVHQYAKQWVQLNLEVL